jgi:hypothetical protein
LSGAGAIAAVKRVLQQNQAGVRCEIGGFNDGAAASLARLWHSLGKSKDAYNLLSPVYNWFTEGFETADLQDARTLLTALET